MTINDNGATVTHTFHLNRERYYYDTHLLALGYQQYDTDQDFRCFGVWVHLEERRIVTFAEGDEYITSCPSLEIFKKELQDMAAFYGAPPPPATSIDTETGVVTHYFADRPGKDLIG